MTRIATFPQHNAVLNELLKANERVFRTQMQVTTGKVAQQYKEIARDAGVLLSAKRVETRTEQYQKTTQELANRLELQDIALEQVASAGQDLRQTILDGISLDSGAALMEQVEGAFRQALSALNTRLEGNYIFGGTRSDQLPVAAQDLADLTAVPLAADVFDNNTQRIGVEIDAGQVVELNFFADEVGLALMQSFKRIADFNAGPSGPISGNLTTAQRNFLDSEAATLKTITEGLNNIVARNGQYQREVDDAAVRHEATETYVRSFISDIENVDLAEAVSRLNEDQVLTEASARILSDLRKTSLLEYL